MRVPKEHGAWAMLYVPFVLGVLAAGRSVLGAVPQLALLLLAVTGLFLGRESLLAWWRARDRGHDTRVDGRNTLWQLGGAVLCGGAVLALEPPLAVLPLAVAGAAVLGTHVVQMRRREGRTVGGEILAILGLTMTAPAAFLVGRGAWDARALLLWVLAAAFFASSIFHVRLRILSLTDRRRAERDRLRRASAAYHLALVAALGGAALARWSSPWVVAGFAPVILRALAGLRAGLRAEMQPANLTRAGVLEILYSIVFLVCVGLAAHSG